MKFSMRSALLALNLTLATSLTYLSGVAAGHLVHQQILHLPVPPSPAPTSAPGRSVVDNGQPKEAFTAILERNVLEAERTPAAKPVAIESGPVVPSAPVVTSLNLELIGTIIYPHSAYAIITTRGGTVGPSFGLGQCFRLNDLIEEPECPSGAVKLMEVNERQAKIFYSGREEILPLKEVTALPPDLQQVVVRPGAPPPGPTIAPNLPSAPAPGQPPAPAPNAPAASAPNAPAAPAAPAGPPPTQDTFRFQKDWVDEQLKDFNSLLTSARVVAMPRANMSVFCFKFVKEGSVYVQLGIKPGDCLLEVNGTVIDNPTKGLELFNKLRSEREIVLKLERDGQPKVLRYYID